MDSLVGPGPAVPFVAQGSLLCGGAAAAMLERFWGARGVYAEDYAHLVRADEGGIRTTDLALALRRRGYLARVSQHDPGAVLARLEKGVPAILLLGDGSAPLHYVVLTAASPSTVHYHDPKVGPDRAVPRAELLARWGASGFWALLAQPAQQPPPAAGSARVEDGGAAPEHRRSPSEGPALHPDIVAALERVRSGDYTGAGTLAGGVIDAGGPDTLLARRILATARFRNGDAEGALEEWNRLSEPSIDLVDVRGAAGTRHEILTIHTGLVPAQLLTGSSLTLARRRLADMPALETSRIDYRPLPDGTVEIRGRVTEAPPWPTPFLLATQATQALLDDRTEWELGPHLGLGERWRLHGSWSPAQRRIGSSLSAPLTWPAAVATVDIEWVRERYDLDGVVSAAGAGGVGTAERLRGGIALRRWIAPHMRLEGGVWLERWDGIRRMVSGRISALSLLGSSGDVRVEADLEGWTGRGEELGRASLRAALVRSHGAHRASRATVGGTVTSRSAPRTLWPGAGTGELRAPLLRGHPLGDGDAIGGAAFAPRLLHATLEHRIFGRFGPLSFGGALFLDGAYVWSDPRRESARTFADFGLGAFVASGTREAMISLAAGPTGPVLSARVGAWPAT